VLGDTVRPAVFASVDPTTTFLVRVGAGVLLGLLWFGLSGLLLASLAGLAGRSRLLLAPIFGAAAWGTASCLLFHFFPYVRSLLVAAFVLFTGCTTSSTRSWASSFSSWIEGILCFRPTA
jgi:hypothetical protein